MWSMASTESYHHSLFVLTNVRHDLNTYLYSSVTIPNEIVGDFSIEMLLIIGNKLLECNWWYGIAFFCPLEREKNGWTYWKRTKDHKKGISHYVISTTKFQTWWNQYLNSFLWTKLLQKKSSCIHFTRWATNACIQQSTTQGWHDPDFQRRHWSASWWNIITYTYR